MRYMMKQKLFCWGDDFTIKNEQGQDVFFVDGKAFSIGEKLSFQDMAGNELAFISQKLLSWGPTYEIESEGRLMAVVKKELFTLFRCKFTVDVPGPDDLEAQGRFLDMEYMFNRAGETVAEVSKRWFSFTDTYGVDIREGQDDVLILASTRRFVRFLLPTEICDLWYLKPCLRYLRVIPFPPAQQPRDLVRAPASRTAVAPLHIRKRSATGQGGRFRTPPGDPRARSVDCAAPPHVLASFDS